VVGPSKSNFNNVTLPDEDEELLILLLNSDRLPVAVESRGSPTSLDAFLPGL
jgi:hypothetical protein